MTHLYHLFAEALDKKKDIRVVFCDISKAFDKVWHTGLIHKLNKIGISGPLLGWFENYLSERKQRVVINGEQSKWGDILAGVPQGSVLGPLLFLVYINDLAELVGSEIRLFADDTMVYIFVDNPLHSAESLNNDLEIISNWAKNWLVTFSPEKSKSMYCSFKTVNQILPDLLFDNQIITNVLSHKHLGLSLQHNLRWENHINNICITANKRLDIMTVLKYKLDRTE